MRMAAYWRLIYSGTTVIWRIVHNTLTGPLVVDLLGPCLYDLKEKL
jgi:hypothetical protein